MSGFALQRTVNLSVDDTVTAFKAALSAEGFGVLYELDFSRIVEEKTGQRLPGRVVGLGVCSPRLAHGALSADPAVAALLPCGAFAAEAPSGTAVGFLDPDAALGLAAQPALEALGREAKERLERALAAI